MVRPALASIRTRLILLVLAVWVPAVVAFGLLARETYLQQEQAAREDLERSAHNLNLALESELDKAAVQARTLASSRALAARDFGVLWAESKAASSADRSWVLVVTRDEQVINTLLPEPRRVARVPQAPFLTQGAGVFFTPRGPLTGRPGYALFVPEEGRRPPEYNVGVAFFPAVLQSMVARQNLPPGGVASLVNADFRVMARNREPERWIGQQATGPLKAHLEQGRTGFLETVTLDGIASVTFVTPPNRYGWRAVFAQPVAVFERSARELTLRAVGAAGALLVIGLLLASFASLWISRPVGALKDAAGNLAAGGVPHPLATGIREIDEVGIVLHGAGVRFRESGRHLEQRVEEAVRAAQQAQARLFEARKHEVIGRLTGGLAHDFNNLLQTISMGLQLVQRGVPEGRHTRSLQAAMAACGRAADLVRQMLAFGRQQALKPQPVSLDDLLLRSRELTGKALGERITLRAEVEPGLPPVHADPAQLELALLNLVFNARDAMPSGGTVAILCRRAGPEEQLAGGSVCIDVIDDGTGMDEQTLSRVFEPYFTTKPVGAGSGLGLPHVQSFARQSGGDVLIRSKVGEGTRVTLVLPMAAAEPASPSAGRTAAAAAPRRPLRVLMVEDDLLVASVVPGALEREGHHVAVCRTADEAINLLGGRRVFDVVFTDVVMPGALTGFDLVAWCREHRPGLAVLVATGYTTQLPPVQVPILRKPYGVDDLLAALDQAARDVDAAPAAQRV